MRRRTVSFWSWLLVLWLGLALPLPAQTGRKIPISGTAPGQSGYTELTFKLYNQDRGGTFLGYADAQGLEVTDEAFYALLGDGSGGPVPAGLFVANASIYVAVELTAAPGTELGPRVPLYSSGFAHGAQSAVEAQVAARALTLTPGSAISGALPTTALLVNNTAGPGVNVTGTSFGLRGETNSSDPSVAGVIGRVTASMPGSFSAGVYGRNEGTGAFGIGVWGEHNGGGWGVYGTSVSGMGVRGLASSATGVNFGVYGQTNSVDGVAVYGRNTATQFLPPPFSFQVGGTAIRGESSQVRNGIGVQGIGFIGVYGEGRNSDGRGVYGTGGTLGIGVEGNGRTGVYGRTTDANGTAVLGTIPAGGTGYAGDFQGRVRVTGTLSKGGGSFKIDHPLDPENKYLYHSFVESPDMMNIYNGNAVLDGEGEAWVALPAWFEALNRDFRYQLTSIGGFAPVYIAEEVSNNRFKIAGGRPGGKVSWQVTGVRKDPFAEQYRIPVEEDKPAVEKGYYLHPDAYGQPETKGVDWGRNREGMQFLKAEREKARSGQSRPEPQ